MTNTETHTHVGGRGGDGGTSIISFKIAAALDPVLQEIKFQNGPQLWLQNKGA